MESERKNLFDKYLAYGGVDVSPNMFQGVDVKDFENMNTAEIIAASTTAHVAPDKELVDKDGTKCR